MVLQYEAVIDRVKVSLIRNKAEELLNEINNFSRGERSFEIPGIYSLMERLKCTSVSGSSGKKSDLTLSFFNPHTGRQSLVGFSIKSEIGGNPSLINASATTNIVFLVKFPDSISEEEIITLSENNKGLKSFVQDMTKMGAVFQFKCYSNYIFNQNLIITESIMPNIIAEMVLYYNQKERMTSIRDIINDFYSSGNFEKRLGSVITQRNLEIKLKKLLRASALGMNPGTSWDGNSTAHGGYILVKKDGSVVCSHSENEDLLGDYLYNIAKMDNGSRSKHDFGSLYKNDNNEWEIKMNFSVRIN